MRKAALVLLSTLALVLGLSVHADAGAKPAYKVTLVTSVAKSTADHFIVVSGKVIGPKAAGKSVTIQRQYVGGPWITVATATIRSNGRYSARVETPHGGTTSFRALKSKSSVRKAGVSATRSIPVYEWLSLASQSSLHDNNVLTGVQETIGGKTYSSIDIFGDVEISFKLGGLCTKLSAIAEYSGPAGPPPATIDLAFVRYPTSGGPATPVSSVLTIGTPVTVLTSLVGDRVLRIDTANFDSNHQLTIGGPKVYCNASSLPAWTVAELT